MAQANRRVHALAIVAAISLGFATSAFSQSTASPPTGASALTSPTSTQPEASMTNGKSSQTTTQAQSDTRKAGRKANRAQKNAELDKLEKNGYKPTANQSNYPDNIQNAEKKASGQ
jgi:hypothetical protein